MTINSWLSGLFTSSPGPCTDVKFLLVGYQRLSMIYVNIFLLSCMIFWKIIDWFISPLPGDIVILTTTPLILSSLYFLKKDRNDLAALTIISLLHIGNFLSGNISQMSLGAAYSLSFFPGVGFFLSSSSKVHICNLVLCFLQNIGHAIKIQRVFKVTFTDEQAVEILGVQTLSFSAIVFGWMLFYIQKTIETKLWNLAQTNFEKAENITKELVQAIKAKDTFVSSLSHEVRNPLNSINGSINYLLKTIKDTSCIKVLNTAKLSGEILLNLVNNVLDAAKLTTEKMDLCFMETEITDVVKKALAVHSENLKRKEILAQGFIAKDLSPILWTDPSRILQIIMNLVSNAIKFTQKGGKVQICLTWQNSDCPQNTLLKPTQEFIFQKGHSEEVSPFTLHTEPSMTKIASHTNISSVVPSNKDIEEFDQNDTTWSNYTRYHEDSKKKNLTEIKCKYSELTDNFNVWSMYKASASLAAKPEDSFRAMGIKRNTSLYKKGFLKVQVSDTGSGIAQEDIDKVFEMFSQSNQGISSIDGGSGLGLWICKKLCKKMGGDISLYSQLGRGTTVVFYIPIDNHPLSQNVDSRIQPKEKVRALVVDDYAYNRDVHKLILEKDGVEVKLACNGLEALEKYTGSGEGYFDFIMMDIQMPVMDGFTSAKKIRDWENEKNWKAADLYFVSGEYYNEEQIISELESRVQITGRTGIRCLRKPIDVGIIKQIIGQYK